MEVYQGFLTGNLVLDLGILAWAVAQGIKVLLEVILQGKFRWETIFGTGGMPSSHSAFVMALAVSIGVLYGGRSPIFALAAGFAMVVMYDAQNVRREAGKHAEQLNQMMAILKDFSPKQWNPAKALRESLGHTPLQVVVGALLGSCVGALALIWK